MEDDVKCPRCGVEAAIMGTRTEVTGDRSPETETEVWTVLVYRCRNPNCREYGKDVGETRHRIFPEGTGELPPPPAGGTSLGEGGKDGGEGGEGA